VEKDKQLKTTIWKKVIQNIKFFCISIGIGKNEALYRQLKTVIESKNIQDIKDICKKTKNRQISKLGTKRYRYLSKLIVSINNEEIVDFFFKQFENTIDRNLSHNDFYYLLKTNYTIKIKTEVVNLILYNMIIHFEEFWPDDIQNDIISEEGCIFASFLKKSKNVQNNLLKDAQNLFNIKNTCQSLNKLINARVKDKKYQVGGCLAKSSKKNKTLLDLPIDTLNIVLDYYINFKSIRNNLFVKNKSIKNNFFIKKYIKEKMFSKEYFLNYFK